MENKRKFARVLFDTPAQLENDLGCWSTRLVDLCLNGAMVTQPEGFQSSPSLQLSFTLPQSDILVQMTAEPIYSNKGHLGLKCAFIDVDSITHLRRLLELNTGDSTQLHRELTQFIQEHEQALAD